MKIQSIKIVAIAFVACILGMGIVNQASARIDVDCKQFGTNQECYDYALEEGHRLYVIGNHKKSFIYYSALSDVEHASQKGGRGIFHFAWALFQEASSLRSGMENHLEQSLVRLEWAAAYGFAPAMNNLGQYYYFGIGTEIDKKEAFKWHLAAAEAGNPVAAANVRLAYIRGEGVDKNLEEAKKWENVSFKNTNPADIEEPTLERTLLDGNYLPESEIAGIRESAKTKAILHFTYTPEVKGASIDVALGRAE